MNIISMNIGGLYTYPALRYVYKDLKHCNVDPLAWIAWIERNEPFVVLEVKNYDYKVLTTKGVVGWIKGILIEFEEITM